MEKYDIYKDIASRTEGDIYIGVVGPVRSGKSTFIKKFIELAVLPNMTDEYEISRTKDELPQSGQGKQIMTTEPKFVPNSAALIKLEEDLEVKVRLVDCVGYVVEDAKGYKEEEEERMVKTPWFEDPIPFKDAATFTTFFNPLSLCKVETVFTTGHPNFSDNLATSIFVCFFSLTSLLFNATTTGIPNSNNCVVKNKLRLKFVESTILIITSGFSF